MKFLAVSTLSVFIVLSIAWPSVQGIDFQGVINDIKKGVNVANNFLGENGEFPRKPGCNVRWNIQGSIRGVEWVWICTCIDACTGIVEVQTKSSREGAMEHCYTRLFSKLESKNVL